MGRPVKTPSCFGLLFDPATVECPACLLNGECKELSKRIKDPGQRLPVKDIDIDPDLPKDKKSLILAVCKKYGIEPTWRDRKQGSDEVIITEENVGDFFNIDFLITTKTALRIFLSTKIEQ